jgi:hypothetical protein
VNRITHLARNHSGLGRFVTSAAIALSLALPAVAVGYADAGTGVRYLNARPTANLTPFPPGQHRGTLERQSERKIGAPSPQSAGQSASQPSVSAAQPTDNNAGFDVGDAAVGAGVALGLVVLSGAGLAMRRHVRSTPQPIS